MVNEPESVVLAGGIRAAAKHLGRGERAMYRLAKRGKLSFCIKVGGTYVIPLAAWSKWLETAGGNFSTTPAAPGPTQEGR